MFQSQVENSPPCGGSAHRAALSQEPWRKYQVVTSRGDPFCLLIKEFINIFNGRAVSLKLIELFNHPVQVGPGRFGDPHQEVHCRIGALKNHRSVFMFQVLSRGNTCPGRAAKVDVRITFAC